MYLPNLVWLRQPLQTHMNLNVQIYMRSISEVFEYRSEAQTKYNGAAETVETLS
jgi:hypothetical protein